MISGEFCTLFLFSIYVIKTVTCRCFIKSSKLTTHPSRLSINQNFFHASLAAPNPQKKGSGETVGNFEWMTFTGYVSVMPASIQPDPLEVIKA